MYAAYPYDLSSTERVEETVTVADAKIFLRHIPKKNSIVIDGFTETQAAVVPQNHFRCDYEDEKSWYRDANRILYVNAAHNGQTLSVSYVAIGTVLTAAIWNEIKRHLDTPHAAQYTLPTASDEVKGGVKVGDGLCMNDDTLNVNAGTGLEVGDDTLNCTVKGGYFHDCTESLNPLYPSYAPFDYRNIEDKFWALTSDIV